MEVRHKFNKGIVRILKRDTENFRQMWTRFHRAVLRPWAWGWGWGLEQTRPDLKWGDKKTVFLYQGKNKFSFASWLRRAMLSPPSLTWVPRCVVNHKLELYSYKNLPPCGGRQLAWCCSLSVTEECSEWGFLANAPNVEVQELCH